MPTNGPTGSPSGFICPRCGGPLWEQTRGSLRFFQCRIGDAFTAAQLWIDHCIARNTALKVAARSLAENAALAHTLAGWARQQGETALATRLEAEGQAEEEHLDQIWPMLAGLIDQDARADLEDRVGRRDGPRAKPDDRRAPAE